MIYESFATVLIGTKLDDDLPLTDNAHKKNPVSDTRKSPGSENITRVLPIACNDFNPPRHSTISRMETRFPTLSQEIPRLKVGDIYLWSEGVGPSPNDTSPSVAVIAVCEKYGDPTDTDSPAKRDMYIKTAFNRLEKAGVTNIAIEFSLSPIVRPGAVSVGALILIIKTFPRMKILAVAPETAIYIPSDQHPDTAARWKYHMALLSKIVTICENQTVRPLHPHVPRSEYVTEVTGSIEGADDLTEEGFEMINSFEASSADGEDAEGDEDEDPTDGDGCDDPVEGGNSEGGEGGEEIEVPARYDTDVLSLEEYLRADVPTSWESFFELVMEDDQKGIPYISAVLASRNMEVEIYPPMHSIFTIFERCRLEDVKVLILGQDPYHGEGQAVGMAFAVGEDVAPPPSLVNIYKELITEGFTVENPRSGDLSGWVAQGVFLLNTALTVEASTPDSHTAIWENFTLALLGYMNANLTGYVAMLWGAKAQKFTSYLSKAKIVATSHPSPLSVYRGFFGSDCFNKANNFLKAMKKEPIDWSL